MNKKDIVDFFDRCAPWWDERQVIDEDVLTTIFTLGGIKSGADVLDVACGTGVLFPCYEKSNVASVTAIDVSPQMVEIAKRKFPQVEVVCGDAETHHFEKQFDVVMIYNAFPHFANPQSTIAALAQATKIGGKLCIAHGMSRAALLKHHQGLEKVSAELPEAQQLAKQFAPYFEVDAVVSTDRMYLVSGVRRKNQPEK